MLLIARGSSPCALEEIPAASTACLHVTPAARAVPKQRGGQRLLLFARPLSLRLVEEAPHIGAVLEEEAALAQQRLALWHRRVLLPEVRDLLPARLHHDVVPGRLEARHAGLALLSRRAPVRHHQPVADLVPLDGDAGAVLLRDLVVAHLLNLHVEPPQIFSQLISGYSLSACQVILFPVLICLCQHALDVFWAQPALVIFDLDLGLVVLSDILRTHFEYAIGVQSECDTDLRHTTQRLWNPYERELSKEIVVFDLGALALVDADVHVLLVVLGGAEVLALCRGDRRVALDQPLHQAPHSLDAQ
mmetsp:Transcript_73165/g.207472  ORF Transcript_73165/g.207472 Transcript_73165/m.207472 type:complete len:304 (+) Transcript_73165:98-1009(+)